MGNIVDRISNNKVETLLLATIATTGYLLYQQHCQKHELKEMLFKALQSKESGIK